MALYLDLSKAFDTVNHKNLLRKLDHYVIRGLPLKLMESYLTNRKQYTVVNGVKPELLQINTRVPQGFTLGPLLFLFYINNLTYVSELISIIIQLRIHYLHSRKIWSYIYVVDDKCFDSFNKTLDGRALSRTKNYISLD